MKSHENTNLVACAGLLLALVFPSQAKTYGLPSGNKAVEAAITTTNLQTRAAATTDPDVWLGLSMFPYPGEPVRHELASRAVKAKPEYAPVAAVLTMAMDGADDRNIAHLIKQDPNNALGYYLTGVRRYKPGETNALTEFRKAAKCPELRVYGGTISNVLFKALDVLELKGRERLCAASWLATRWGNFEIGNLQGQRAVLGRIAKSLDLKSRKQLSEYVLTLGGHFVASDLMKGRAWGESALRMAFRMKADIAAEEKSPTMIGYAGAVQALVSTRVKWPGLKHRNPMNQVTFFPGRLWSAVLLSAPTLPEWVNEKGSKVPVADRPAFEKARAATLKEAAMFAEAALTNQDEVIGAFFSGYLPRRTNAPAPWILSYTHVERLIARRPELFAVFEEYDEASSALHRSLNPNNWSANQRKDPEDAKTKAKNDCIQNLRRIDGEKQAWAIIFGKRASDTPQWADLKGGFRNTIPQCPSGGAYSIGSMKEKPKCAIPGHVCP